MEKAFDKVWRAGLKEKVHKAGVNGNMFRWIENYLEGRTAKVKLQGKTSIAKRIEEGVPQGGILSPTLFISFINDILENMPTHTKGLIFADDVALCNSAENVKIAEILL